MRVVELGKGPAVSNLSEIIQILFVFHQKRSDFFYLQPKPALGLAYQPEFWGIEGLFRGPGIANSFEPEHDIVMVLSMRSRRIHVETELHAVYLNLQVVNYFLQERWNNAHLAALLFSYLLGQLLSNNLFLFFKTLFCTRVWTFEVLVRNQSYCQLTYFHLDAFCSQLA